MLYQNGIINISNPLVNDARDMQSILSQVGSKGYDSSQQKSKIS